MNDTATWSHPACGFDGALYVYGDDFFAHYANVYLYPGLAKPCVRMIWRNINAHSRKELIG